MALKEKSNYKISEEQLAEWVKHYIEFIILDRGPIKQEKNFESQIKLIFGCYGPVILVL